MPASRSHVGKYRGGHLRRDRDVSSPPQGLRFIVSRPSRPGRVSQPEHPDIWGWIIPCWGRPACCGMFHSFSGFYLLEASPPLHPLPPSCDNQKYFQKLPNVPWACVGRGCGRKAKSTPYREPLLYEAWGGGEGTDPTPGSWQKLHPFLFPLRKQMWREPTLLAG